MRSKNKMHQLILQPRQWPSVLYFFCYCLHLKWFSCESDFPTALFEMRQIDKSRPQNQGEKIMQQWYPNFNMHLSHLENASGQGPLGPIPRVSDSVSGIINTFGLCPWFVVQSSPKPWNFLSDSSILCYSKEPPLSTPIYANEVAR